MLPNLVGMKQLVTTFLLLIFTCLQLAAQKPDLIVKSGEKGLYLEHKVVAKESFFSIGRLYNVHPRHVAGFNKLDINKGLQIDQRLRIPLTDTNFTQKGNSGTPVYFKPAAATALSDISKQHNQVAVSSLKAWNNMTGDQAKKDGKLVIGFLLSKEFPSVTLKVKPVEPVREMATQPEVKEPVPAPVKEEKPVLPETKPAVEKPQVVVEEKPVQSVPVITTPSDNSGQGFFKVYFEQQIRKTPVSKEETVTSGIFKTTSGWQDEKYYLLADGIAPGTVVRLTNPATNKTVFAKVLGEMNGIRQNEGYNIRISNAAAVVLQAVDTEKFILKISY